MHDLILEPARLTDSGRPILSSSQEVERFLYEGVSLGRNGLTPAATLHGTLTSEYMYEYSQREGRLANAGGRPVS